MLCSLSGEVPESPVVSKKSGNVFEKRLIESYISEHGRDPVTHEELGVDDLLEVKSARVTRPRPPTFTSIPSLLSEFQKEWDAIALETFNLRQQLHQTRQELSTALYQNDAAIRVIARLTQERNEARDVLAKINVQEGPNANGDSMQLDNAGLPAELASEVESTQSMLSKTRRKRDIPEDWATNDALRALEAEPLRSLELADPTCMALDKSGDKVLVGTKSGNAKVVSLSKEDAVRTLGSFKGAITAVLWCGTSCVLASSTGSLQVYDEEREIFSISQHSDAITALAIHPSGRILASVGLDMSLIFYDLSKAVPVAQVFTDCALSAAAFHPDGHLFATGTQDGRIKIFDVKSGGNVANFETPGAVTAIDFSENGTWLVSVSRDQTDVAIWDLRKAVQIKSLEVGSPVASAKWDYTGQFLVVTGSQGTAVMQYSKAAKSWGEVLRHALPADAVQWGLQARSLVLLGTDGALVELK